MDVSFNDAKITIESKAWWVSIFGEGVDAFITVTTPFEGYSEMRLDISSLIEPTYEVGITYTHNQEKLFKFKMNATVESPTSLAIIISTPYEGFRDISFNVSVAIEPVHSVTITYLHDGNKIQLMGKYEDNNGKTNTKNNPEDYSYDYENYNERPDYDNEEYGNFTHGNGKMAETMATLSFESIFNDQKITADLSVTTGSAPTGYKFNVSAAMATPFDFLRNAKLSTDFEEEYKNGHLNYRGNGAIEVDDFKVTFLNRNLIKDQVIRANKT